MDNYLEHTPRYRAWAAARLSSTVMCTEKRDERIVKYKIRNSLPVDNPRIAVIVQLQIPSETSGVAFSLNPLSNCFDEALINASFGLGEMIVAGLITPDTYVIEKNEGEILEKKIANKATAPRAFRLICGKGSSPHPRGGSIQPLAGARAA